MATTTRKISIKGGVSGQPKTGQTGHSSGKPNDLNHAKQVTETTRKDNA